MAEWGFTAEEEAELADIAARASLAGMIQGTHRHARAILGAGYRRTEAPSELWELREDDAAAIQPPREPCGCVHYLGQYVSRCQGPHTVGTGDSLRWADTASKPSLGGAS